MTKKKHMYGKTNLATKEVKEHAPMGPSFLSFGGRVGVLDYYCSHYVPITFPNMFPIAPHFMPYSLP
jgi:hypothetical protein